MANSNSTLDPFASKPKEQKISPMARIGFFDEMGSLEELIPNPEKLIADGGSLLKEGVGAIGELFKVDIMPAKGSIEFQKKQQPPNPEEQKKQELAAHQRQSYNVQKGESQVVEQREQELNRQEASRLMVSGMSNEEQNTKLKLNKDYKQEYKGAYHLQLLRTQVKQEMESAKKAQDQQVASEIGPKGPDFNKNKANELGPTSIYNAAG